MNYLLLCLSSFISLTCGLHSCVLNPPEFIYDLPEGFSVLHTFEKNGLLGVTDNLGNGMEVYVTHPLQKSRLKILEEKRYKDGSYRIKVDNPGPIDPYDMILIIPKEGYVIHAYFFYDGDSQTYGAFEKKAVKLARSIAHGGRDGNAFESCFVGVLGSFNLLNFGEGRSANVSAVPVR